MGLKAGVGDWALLMFTSAMFASSFFFHKISGTTIPPLTIAAARVVLALPICWGVLRAAGERFPRDWRDWRPLVLLGIIGVAVPYISLAWGQQFIETGLAGIIFATGPLLTIVLAPLFLPEEPFTPRRGVGVVIGLGGVVLVIGPSALGGISDHLVGQLAILISPFCYTVVGIYVRRRLHISALLLPVGQFLCAAPVLVALSLALDAPWRLSPTPAALASIVAIGVIATAVPGMLVFRLLRTVGATTTSLMAFLIPGFAVVYGAILLGERLSWPALAGLGLILLGAFAAGWVSKGPVDGGPAVP